MDRRSFLKGTAALPLASAMPPFAVAAVTEKADYTLRIGAGLVELAPEHIVSTTLYNGQFPGPLLRFKEGKRVGRRCLQRHRHAGTVCTGTARFVPSDVDGAAEEGTPYIPPHGMRRIAFVPKPAGFRFYHTHVVAGGRSQSRHLHRPGRSGLHRAERTSPEPTIARCSWC